MVKIRKVIMLLMLMCLMIFSIKINAEMVTIPRTDSGVVKHLGSGENVYINSEYQLRDSEFRAVWVSALVSDISTYESEAQYKAQMLDVLNTMEYFNMNAMVFHIRIMNDAFYPSAYSPYSIYYSTNPDWIALPWLIEECHKRGIEFHAWMNPYRVRNGQHNLQTLASEFPASNMASNPNNLLQGQNAVILNPCIPEIQEWLVDVCMEVVEKYDVDAIHFDDYFYDNQVDDSATRRIYNTNNLSLGDFRRLQVDTFIKNLSESIRENNAETGRSVQLGISPSGVYRSGNGVVTYDSDGNAITNGSMTTTSYEHYDNYLYSDTLKWVNEEWIDYILPQAYWAIEHPMCPFADLMQWWNDVAKYKKVNVYAGIGLYQRESASTYSWYKSPRETYYQLMIINGMEKVQGSCFFAYRNVYNAMRNPSHAEGWNTLWSTPVVLPEIQNTTRIVPQSVKGLKVESNSAGYKLSFNANDETKFYCIYKSTSPITFSPNELYDVIGKNGDITEYVDKEVEDGTTYYYGVKCQSYSLTLGDGVSVSTDEALPGSLANLGSVEDLHFISPLSPEQSNTLVFKASEYPFGTKITYLLEYSFDDNEKETLTKYTLRNGYICFDLVVPEEADNFVGKVISTNDIGYSETMIEEEVRDSLPAITNFGYVNTLYTGEYGEFVWNNLNIEGVKYSIQYSSDGFTWLDLEKDIDGKKDFNIKKRVIVNIPTGMTYFRVFAEKDGLISMSNQISVMMYRKVSAFDTLTINGSPYVDTLNFEVRDTMVIKWQDQPQASGLSYVVRFSPDLTDWSLIRAYNSSSYLNLINGYYEIEIPIDSLYYKVYISIEGLSENGRSVSEIYEFTVSVDWMYPTDIANYVNNELEAFTVSMDIYN